MLVGKDLNGRRLATLLLPSIASLVWCMVLLSNQAPRLIGKRLSGDGDFAQHLTLGRLMLEQRAILKVDPTLYSVGPLPWFGHEWLTELCFAFTHAKLGLIGPVLLVSVLLASACALMLREALDLTEAAWPALLAFGLAAPLLVPHLLIRPHIVSWFFAILWQRRLNLWARGAIDWVRWLLLALPLMVLWCNLHGGFLLGFVLIALEGAALGCSVVFGSAEARAPALRRGAQLGLGALLLFAASGLNPFGFGLHWHLFQHLSRTELLHHVNEFRSPDFFSIDDKPLLIWITLSFALAAACHGGSDVSPQRPLHSRLLQLALLWMTLSSQRNAALFALLSAPIVAQDLARVLRAATTAPGAWGRIARSVSESSTRLALQDRARDGRIWALVLFAFLLIRAPQASAELGFTKESQPIAAARYIRAHAETFRGHMFNAYAWGGYLAYELYPAQKCFISGMADYYGPELFFDYRTVATLQQGWEQVLTKYRVDFIVFDANSPLASALRLHPGWREIYRDELAVIFLRKDALAG
jgi:hypothetical protein